MEIEDVLRSAGYPILAISPNKPSKLAETPDREELKYRLLSGRKLSFDHLEQKLIRPVFEERRIHFALNCASESCPPLHDRPFTAATLDADLEQLTRAFINDNPQGIAVKGRTIHLSKLLKWYADDFGGENNLLAYLNSYRESPLPANATVEFMDFSWKLNEISRSTK